jgi:hypothetical protein
MGQQVECVDPHGHSQVVGLENLYRQVRREPREQWPALIREFLHAASLGEAEQLLPAELATVADQLLVRLGPPLPRMPERDPVWSQSLVEGGLCLNLVVDYPNRMCYVTEQLVNSSGQTGGNWMERALANLRARTPADCLGVVDEESGMRLCAVGDAYDSSRALILDTLLPDTAADGCFVAVPGRDQLLVLPVSSQGIGFIHLLKVLAGKNFQSAPYPISDDVFWVRAGVWRVFGIDISGQQATLQPPEEFLEVLQRLAPDIDVFGPDDSDEAEAGE